MKNKIDRFIQDYKKALLTNTINLLGMAIGLAVVILIGWWTLVELSFDRFHDGVDETYRVMVEGVYNDEKDIDPTVSPCFSTELPKMMPDIKEFTSVVQESVKMVKAEGKSFYQSDIGMASSNFFTFFDFPLLFGDKNQCLNAYDKIVIDEVTALKLYGKRDAIGKIFEFQGHTFKVSAIMKEMPSNSSIRLRVVGSVAFIYKAYPWARATWSGFDRFSTYYKFIPRTDLAALADKMTKKIYEVEPEEQRNKVKVIFQPLKEVHLYSPSDRYKRLIILVSLATLILVISCLNFSNLFVFTSLSQLKRIAIRRIYGASTFSIIRSLYWRSLVYVLLSCGLGLILSVGMSSLFNEVLGTVIHFDFTNPILWAFLFIVIIIVSVVTTLYPACVVLKSNEIESLKGTALHVGNKKVQKLFIVVQFTVSIALLSYVMMVNQQFRFLDQRDNGLKQDNVVFFNALGEMPKKYQLFKKFVTNSDNQQGCCYSSTSPASWDDGVMVALATTPTDKIHAEYAWVSRNYFDFLGIDVQGDCFDSSKECNNLVVINRAAVERLHLKDAIGKRVILTGETFLVAGVTSEVHRDPFNALDYPLVYRYYSFTNLSADDYIMVRTTGESQTALRWVEAQWNKVNPNLPFRYEILSETFKLKYAHQNNQNRMMSLLMIIALIISLIGMFAMANFTVESRRKEFAIRRVNGASTAKIFALQVLDFMIPIFLSYILSIPLFLFFSDQFLSLFAFKVTIGVWNYIIPLVIVLSVSLVAVLFQCIKASRTNPIEVLRYE
ncbi:ABC transporter permease [Halosquirtibacter xylanolyticus]|uniref:ABC transporter permease n=1 Tax=Halosquirtibacter xylanolyticus TaxID=3374599 RepID=UPI0037499076|nr:ABC transporter permease [Prolixibacteraceae bacterium]